jgi:hypothetical protein
MERIGEVNDEFSSPGTQLLLYIKVIKTFESMGSASEGFLPAQNTALLDSIFVGHDIVAFTSQLSKDLNSIDIRTVLLSLHSFSCISSLNWTLGLESCFHNLRCCVESVLELLNGHNYDCILLSLFAIANNRLVSQFLGLTNAFITVVGGMASTFGVGSESNSSEELKMNSICEQKYEIMIASNTIDGNTVMLPERLPAIQKFKRQLRYWSFKALCMLLALPEVSIGAAQLKEMTRPVPLDLVLSNTFLLATFNEVLTAVRDKTIFVAETDVASKHQLVAKAQLMYLLTLPTGSGLAAVAPTAFSSTTEVVQHLV